MLFGSTPLELFKFGKTSLQLNYFEFCGRGKQSAGCAGSGGTQGEQDVRICLSKL
jgi:hypothetical protein